MTDTPKTGRPPMGEKAMTPAERKAKQRQRQGFSNPTKEQFISELSSTALPYFVTRHIVNGTTDSPEYRLFVCEICKATEEEIKNIEKWFYRDDIANRLRRED